MRVKVCNVCGSRGFSDALVYCTQCVDTTVHQYCVGIAPGSLDDICCWVCEYCSAVMEPESCTCHTFLSASNQRGPESCTVHAETLTVKCKSGTMFIPDQPESLCMLYPVTCKKNSEPWEFKSRSQVAEKVSRTASTALGDSLDYRKGIEDAVSSFMDYPESIMYRLLFLVSPSGKIIIRRSTYLCDEFNSQNAGDSTAGCSLNYGEEPGAQVSSLMEYPETINGEIVLLVKPAGEIIFHCGLCGVSAHDDSHLSCWKATMHKMANSSSEINSDKLVLELVPYSFTPDSFSFDEVIYRNRDSRNDSSTKEVVEPNCVLNTEADLWSSDDSAVFSNTDVQGDTVFEYVVDSSEDVEGSIQQSCKVLDVDGSKFKYGMNHRKTARSSSIIYDILQPISPECKRARCERHMAPPSKKVDVCRVVVSDIPAAGSVYKQGTKRKKTMITKSLARCDHVPPLQPNCRRARSKRRKVRSILLSQPGT